MAPRTKKSVTKKGENTPEDPELFFEELSKTGNPEEKSTFRMSNQKIMLTYASHLPKVEFKEWFENLINDGIKQYTIKTIEMAHEKGDKSHNYLHTHVVIDFGQPFNTNRQDRFNWPNTDPQWNNGKDIHPNIRIIRSPTHWRRSLAYLAKEDGENGHLIPDAQTAFQKLEALRDCKDDLEVAKELFEGKEGNKFNPMALNQTLQLLDRIGSTAEVEPMSFHPNTFSHPWQVRLIQHVSAKPTGRFIRWIVDPHEDGGTGKTSFARSLSEWYPKEYIYVPSCDPRSVGLHLDTAITKHKLREIKVLIIDISRSKDKVNSGFNPVNLYKMIEELSNGLFMSDKYRSKLLSWLPGHVVCFANWYPTITTGTLSRERLWITTLNKFSKKDCIFKQGVNMIKTASGSSLAKEFGYDKLEFVEFDREEMPPELD